MNTNSRRMKALRQALALGLHAASTGISATHVPSRGAAPALQDVLAGQVEEARRFGTVVKERRINAD